MSWFGGFWLYGDLGVDPVFAGPVMQHPRIMQSDWNHVSRNVDWTHYGAQFIQQEHSKTPQDTKTPQARSHQKKTPRLGTQVPLELFVLSPVEEVLC